MAGVRRVKRRDKFGGRIIRRARKFGWQADRLASQCDRCACVYGAGFEAFATTLDSFWRFDSTGFS